MDAQSPVRILVATDAWHPQVNGVVHSLESVAREAPQFGASLHFLTPQRFRTVGMPTYPEIRLSLATPWAISHAIDEIAPTHFHIATEGPIGFLVHRYCRKHEIPFTTSYHTRFPEYIAARAPIPKGWSYAALRWFHNCGAATMVTTPSLQAELQARGFARIVRWSRGVDTDLFRPDRRPADGASALPFAGPIFLYVGRIAVEKNIEAFLALDLPGTKVIVGEGPQRAELEARFPQARFLGLKKGEALADIYAAADVFVFPSRTDTFGIVILEALAAGLPVAAYPVTGPADVLTGTDVGVLSEDLRAAARAALDIPKDRCRTFALGATWSQSAKEFVSNVVQSCRARAPAGAR